MRLRILGICMIGLASSAVLEAATLNVPGSYPTIQSAINASSAGDVVLVAPGVYSENLLVGPAGNGATIESSGGAGSTAIDGSAAGRVLVILGVGPTTRIRGFTIRNGNAAGPGGGIYIGGASPTIEDCVIEGNAAHAGAGVYTDAAFPLLERCIIRNNHAPFGSGGGVYADNTSIGTSNITTLNYCIVYGNSCGAYGGGVTAWERAVARMDHCTVADNAGALAGGNLYFTRAGFFQVTKCVVAFPSANANVQAALNPGASTFGCSDFHSPSLANFVGLGSPVGANANFDLDPQFCDRGAGQYGLTSLSPCASGANTNGCGLVGARDVECGVVSTEKRSWGGIKNRYR